MPLYERCCPKCEHEFDVFLPMKDYRADVECPRCGTVAERVIRTPPLGRADPLDWSTENGGKGRYITQLQTSLGNKRDNHAYCRNQQEIKDKAKARGLVAENVG